MAPTFISAATPSIILQPTMLNAALIIFCIALATYMFYLIQCDINAQVQEFRSAALPFSVRLAFARVRLQNAEDRLDRLGKTDSGDVTDCIFFVQKRLVIKQYVEIEAEGPLKALEQAERYRRWWWTGIVNAPVLLQYEKEAILERDSDDDGYWLSEEE